MRNKLNLNELLTEDWEWIYSYSDAEKEDEYRVETLREVANEIYLNPGRRYSNADMHNLADKLEICSDDEPCESPACKRCTRNYQIKIVETILRAMKNDLKEDPDIRYCAIHLIQYSRSVELNDFVYYDIQADKDRLRHLISSSELTGPVLGALEMDFHRTPQKWLSHYHLFTRLTGNEEALARLAGKVGKLHPQHIKTNVRARPFLIQEIKDPLEQISYLYKLGFNEVRDYKTPDQKRRTKKYRLEKRLFCDFLCWMDEMGRKKFLYKRHANDWLRHSDF